MAEHENKELQEEEEKEAFAERDKARLDYLKGVLVNAGYGEELKKYKGNDWFRAACTAGLFRDGRGNAIRPAPNVPAEETVRQMTQVDGAFYVAERDSGEFRKFGSNGAEGFTSMAYSTPPVIDRPGMLLRFLDYCGFNIPSVKEYKRQMQSVKQNPVYDKLHNSKARELSNRFVVSSSRLPMIPEEERVREREEELKKQQEKLFGKLQKTNDGPEKAKITDEPEKAKITDETGPAAETDANPGVQQPAEKAEKKPLAVSVEENDGVIKVTMDDGSVQVFEKKAPEKTAEAAVSVPKSKPPVSSEALIDRKLEQLREKEKGYPESSPMGLAILEAKENLTLLKQKGLPADKLSAAYPEQYEATKKAAASLLLVDGMTQLIKSSPYEEASRYFLGRENSGEIRDDLKKLFPEEAIDGALKDNPVSMMRISLADEAGFRNLRAAFEEETEKLYAEKEAIADAAEASLKEQTANAAARSDIDIKRFELTQKLLNYPESSPIGIEIMRTLDSLEEVKKLGLPEDPSSPGYAQQLKNVREASNRLMTVDFMEYTIENGSKEEAYRYSRGSEESSRITDEAESLPDQKALINVLADAPAKTFKEVLASPNGIYTLEKAVSDETQRLAREEEELKQATEASLKEQTANADARSDIDIKLIELSQKEQNYPESSPMGLAILQAKESLEEVRRTGLPGAPSEPGYAEKFDAVCKASKNLLTVDQMEYLMETQPDEMASRLSLGREDSAQLKHDVEALTPDSAVRAALGEKAAGRFEKILASPAGILRFEKEVNKVLMKEEQAQKEKAAAENEKAAEKETEKIIPEKDVPAAKEPEKAADAPETRVSEQDAQIIDRKLEELARKEKNYPEDSPMGLTLHETRESLIRLKQTGLPEDPGAADYAERYAAVQKAASGLLLADQMEALLTTLPEKDRAALTREAESSSGVKKELEKLTSSDAVERSLFRDPAGKMRRLLTDEKAMLRFENNVAKEMRDNPAGNLIPHGSVVYGSVYKVPGKPGWQRMPGAAEEDVRKSLNELSELSPNNKVFRKIAKAEGELPKAGKQNRKTELNDRIEELRKLSEKAPEGSVANRLGKKAADALAALDKTGLPQDPSSPAYKKQQEALKKAVCATCAFERFGNEKKAKELGLDKADDPKAAETADTIMKAYADNKLIETLAATQTARLTGELLENSVEKRGLLSQIRKEENYRKENSIPETAERKGALFRMGPNEKWKEIPGSTLHEVNDSMMTVMDEKHAAALVSYQKTKENIHYSNASLAFGS